MWLVGVMCLASCTASSSSSHTSNTLRDTNTTTAPPACGRQPHPGLSGQTFDFQGVKRTYQLYIPTSYDGAHAVPVVFEFHGNGSTAARQVAYGDFRPLADRDDFIIVAPDGQGDVPHFNLTGQSGEQNDVSMVSSLLDFIEANYCVDPKRIYSTGLSDGGAMTSQLACLEADRFAAFGAVAVVLYPPGCGSSRAVPITAFAGTADPIVPFNGGKVNCCGNPTVDPTTDTMAAWARQDSCDTTPTTDRLGTEVRRMTWTGCSGTSTVVLYIIDGGGHTWPGSQFIPGLGLTTHQINASDTIWAFFKAHPRT